MELDGRVAIVTGGGRGIGRAIALELASMGASIVVAEMNISTAEAVADEVKALGRPAIAVQTDVTERSDLESMTRRSIDQFGRIDILVNNAGIYRADKALEITEEHWDSIMNINLKAVFFASQMVLPYMVAAKRGNIISVASMAGKVGSTTSLAYAVSKTGIISMIKSLAMSFSADGVRVNCVCPGFVQTDMWTAVIAGVSYVTGTDPDEINRQRLAQIPLGRWEQPEDVAKLVGFLASDKSAYMTGQAINVTGGLIMH